MNWLYLLYFKNTFSESQPAGIPSLRTISIFSFSLHRFIIIFFPFIKFNHFYHSYPMLRFWVESYKKKCYCLKWQMYHSISVVLAKCTSECVMKQHYIFWKTLDEIKNARLGRKINMPQLCLIYEWLALRNFNLTWYNMNPQHYRTFSHFVCDLN